MEKEGRRRRRQLGRIQGSKTGLDLSKKSMWTFNLFSKWEMEIVLAPNNLRILPLHLIRNIPQKCFHWKKKMQLNIIKKLRKFSGGRDPRLWHGRGFSKPWEASQRPHCFPLPGSSSLQWCSSPSQLEGPRGLWQNSMFQGDQSCWAFWSALWKGASAVPCPGETADTSLLSTFSIVGV